MNGVRYLDADALAAALPPAAAVEAITAVLTAGFDPASDPARTATPTTHGQLLLMPSELGDYAGVKVATVAPQNTAAGLPRIQAVYLLFDSVTLSLEAVLDGTALTTLRTPAVSLAAVRPALRRVDEPVRAVVFGAGPQAVAHVDTLAGVVEHGVEAVTFVVRRPERSSPAARARGVVTEVDSARATTALAAAHVVVCATTARAPLFPADTIASDAIVIAVGSHEPDARELDGGLLGAASVVVEDIDTARREAGDVILALGDGALDPGSLVPMKDVVTGAASLAAHRPVVFKSVGMSWQDLTIASAVARAHSSMS